MVAALADAGDVDHCLHIPAQTLMARAFTRYVCSMQRHCVGLQVEIIPQGQQRGCLCGNLCALVPAQHAACAEWLPIHDSLPVLHGLVTMGHLAGYGSSRLLVVILFQLQDLCKCQGRLTHPQLLLGCASQEEDT